MSKAFVTLKIAGAAGALCVATSAAAVAFSNEAAFQAAVTPIGTLQIEKFDSYATGAPISALSALGIAFDTLDNGAYPTANPVNACGGFVTTAPNALLNSTVCVLPGYGAIGFSPILSSTAIFGVGFYNASNDDSLRLTFYDSNDVVIEQFDAPGGQPAFVGITTSVAAARFEVTDFGGNGLFALDNLQVAIANESCNTQTGANCAVDAPPAGLLMGLGLLMLACVRRRRLETSCPA